MTDLVITGDLAERLTELSKREQRPVQDILEGMLAAYQGQIDTTMARNHKADPMSLHDFPVDDLGSWPEGLKLRREELYGDDER